MATYPCQKSRGGIATDERDGTGPLAAGASGAGAGQEAHRLGLGSALAGVSCARSEALSGRLGPEAQRAAWNSSGEFSSASGGPAAVEASGRSDIGAAPSHQGVDAGDAARIKRPHPRGGEPTGFLKGAGQAAGRGASQQRGSARGLASGEAGAAGLVGGAGKEAGASAVQQRGSAGEEAGVEAGAAGNSADCGGAGQEAGASAAQQCGSAGEEAGGEARAAGNSADRAGVGGRRVLSITGEKWSAGTQTCDTAFEEGNRISLILDKFPDIPSTAICGADTCVKFSNALDGQPTGRFRMGKGRSFTTLLLCLLFFFWSELRWILEFYLVRAGFSDAVACDFFSLCGVLFPMALHSSCVGVSCSAAYIFILLINTS